MEDERRENGVGSGMEWNEDEEGDFIQRAVDEDGVKCEYVQCAARDTLLFY